MCRMVPAWVHEQVRGGIRLRQRSEVVMPGKGGYKEGKRASV